MSRDIQPASDGRFYSSAWTHNYLRDEGGYIIHAIEEPTPAATLCGVKVTRLQEAGILTIPHETHPGCIRCRAILRKRGVMLD